VEGDLSVVSRAVVRPLLRRSDENDEAGQHQATAEHAELLGIAVAPRKWQYGGRLTGQDANRSAGPGRRGCGRGGTHYQSENR
jgi:hypothetical protein